jgi:SAM-dependent methyltransferase
MFMRYWLYFIYISRYWGIQLAYFIIRYEITGEKKYGIRTIGIAKLPATVSREDRKHLSIYQPLNYYTATRLFNYLQPADCKTTLLDAGCGKGRILAMGAAFGFTDLIGIDLSQKLCIAARKVGEQVQDRYPGTSVIIEQADARYYPIPGTVGVLFLFNPFDGPAMDLFIKRVMESLARQPRPLKILYANPQCRQQWLDAGFKETASFVKRTYLHGSVLEFDPAAPAGQP